jgi:hypothetical protein
VRTKAINPIASFKQEHLAVIEIPEKEFEGFKYRRRGIRREYFQDDHSHNMDLYVSLRLTPRNHSIVQSPTDIFLADVQCSVA